MKVISGVLPESIKRMSEERLSICQSCEFYNAASHRCKACGCFMKVKVLFKQSKCPHNKWISGITEEKKDEQN